jgi:hypothetical protein
MFYTVYQVTNKLNGKIYIGKHQTNNPSDGYYGSGKFIQASIKKYGKENFEKEVLYIFETEAEMNAKEKELITEEFVSRSDTYNAGIGGEGGPHFKGKNHGSYMKEANNKEEHKRNISLSLKKKYANSEHPSKGKNISEEHKQKIKKSRLGKTHSAETLAKIKEARKKQVFNEETRRKMAESAKNRKKKNSGPVD